MLTDAQKKHLRRLGHDRKPIVLAGKGGLGTALIAELDRALTDHELVKIRASQINGCANCLNMHTFEARQAGETEQRIALLAAWHDAPCYSERERAALDWTDHLTLVAEKRAPDAVYAALDAQFSKEEQVKLTMMIININGWNRLAVGFGLFDAGLGWKA